MAIFLFSCNGHSKHWETLSQVESYIEEKPDSALVTLEQIDLSELSGKEEKAKHALLYSMALDKNFVDKTDFEVLQPAIDYYKDNGSATDKLRTYYYQGRIYDNQGKYNKAMQCFVYAISKGSDSNDILTKARALYTQGRIYSTIFEWDKCAETYNEAGELFKQVDKIDSYINCIASMINVYTITGDIEKANHYISHGLNYIDKCNTRIQSYFYSNYITFIVSHNQNDIENVKSIINDYLKQVDSCYIDWLVVANAFLEIGEEYLAMESINHHIMDKSNLQQNIKYNALLANLYERNNKYKDAMDTYKHYIALTDSLNHTSEHQEIRFIEERHNLEMQLARETEAKNKRTIMILSSILALIGCIFVILIIRKSLQLSYAKNLQLEKEKQKYEQLYSDVVAERDALTKMIEDSSAKEETKAVIKARLDVLNKVIISQITGTNSANKKAIEELESLLADKDTFIKSTRLTIDGNNPEFITTLKNQGLTDDEINICCLYAIGLKGKDIMTYMSQPSHYHKSADIRAKFGLSENDTNLSNFLRDMLKK